MKTTVSAFMLVLILVGTLVMAFDVRPVRASGTIYIRADGSIDPPTAPISTIDNGTYTFTANIYDSIVVERNNIIIDGNGYTVQGTGAYESKGIDLSGRSNVTVKNTNVKNFYSGIWLSSSSNNSVSGNNITANNEYGIWLDYSSNYNSVSGNNIANNWYGIVLSSSNNSVSGNNITANNWYGIVLSSSNNSVYHNNFVDNAEQVYSYASNIWDDGYPSGGNYWSDYTDVDNNSGPYQNITGVPDDIWDTSYVIDANNQDRYPFVNLWTPGPDFSISASPTSLSVQLGGSVSSTITITSINDFNQPVQLTVSGAPSGVTATLVPDIVTPPPNGQVISTLTVSVAITAPVGNYTLTVTGTNGALSRSVDLSLEITVLLPPPSIGEVKAFYTLDSFFLGNMTDLVPPNQYFVKGNNIDRVEFSICINGTEQVFMDVFPNAQGWFSSVEYEMAEVTSDLTITAFNEEGAWMKEIVDTNVFETPRWLRGVITLALESELIEITTHPGSEFDNVWRLSAEFQWPEDPFEGEVDLSFLPLIGGEYGVSAGFGFRLGLASDGTVFANGSGSFTVTIADYEGGAGISAEAIIRIGDSITLEDFAINVQGHIKIPIKQKYKWDVWRFSIGVEVGVDFEADASFSFHITEAAGEGTFCDGFDWVQTANDIRFTVRPYAAVGVAIGELRVEGEGTVTITVHVPAPYFTYPDDLRVEATIKLILKTFIHTWEWTVLRYSSGSPVEWSVNASGRSWINRTWATEDYAQYVWTENTTEGNFLENVYLYANPSVAASSETMMMVWTHDDLSKPYIQGYEVYYSLWNPETGVWSLPSPVTDNTIPEDAAMVQFDAWGNAVAVWTQINNSSLSESMDPFSLLNQTELAYAVWNHTTGVWSEPMLITNDYAYDYSPLLVSDQDGNLMLTWLVDQDCNFSTSEDLCIYSSTWNGEQWTSPALVANPGLISSPIQAAYHNGEAVVVWSAHMDGNATTTGDTELFYCQFSNNSWGLPIQLTMNSLEDTEPSAAFRGNHPVFAWIQRNMTDSLFFFDPAEGSPRLVLERLGVACPRLSVDNQNHALVVWADPNSETPYSFSLSPDGNITFVELLGNTSWRSIYCKTLPYQSVIVGMGDGGLVHVIDLDAQMSVSSVTPIKTVVSENRSDQIDVVITNQGYFTQLFNVTLYANSTTAIYQGLVTLQGESATTLSFAWNTTGWAKGNYTITAYITPVLGETDLSDNIKSGWIFVTIAGDTDGDRDVDIFDIVLMAGGYGTLEGQPKFNANCDIDGDGDIDIFDIVRAAGNYGKSW